MCWSVKSAFGIYFAYCKVFNKDSSADFFMRFCHQNQIRHNYIARKEQPVPNAFSNSSTFKIINKTKLNLKWTSINFFRREKRLFPTNFKIEIFDIWQSLAIVCELLLVFNWQAQDWGKKQKHLLRSADFHRDVTLPRLIGEEKCSIPRLEFWVQHHSYNAKSSTTTFIINILNIIYCSWWRFWAIFFAPYQRFVGLASELMPRDQSQK